MKRYFAIVLLVLTGYACAQSTPYYHQIYSATSTDGLNWNVSDVMLFDHASVPGAVYFNNKTYLYYVNAEDPENEKLSVGVSEDRGVTFTVYDVQINGSNSPYPVDPNAIIDEGQVRLTYLGNFNPGTETNKIVTASSSDGINFVEDAIIFTKAEVFDPDLFYYESGWVLFLNTGGLTRATASSSTDTFTEDTSFVWSDGSISSTHQIGSSYYTYYAGQGICVAEYLDGNLSILGSNLLDFPGMTADPTLAVFGPNDYKMFFKTQVEGNTTTTLFECLMGDVDCNGSVSDFELLNFIEQWVSEEVSDFDLLEAIENWAAG